MARRLEAGCINTGLSALQVIFNQLKKQNALSKTIGNGLRRILYPYINTQTYLSVLFTLSPSVSNAKATESTLKFAVTAGMVKVKPVAVSGNINFDKLVAELKAYIERQEQSIDSNQEEIEGLQRTVSRLKVIAEHYRKGGKSGEGPSAVKSGTGRSARRGGGGGGPPQYGGGGGGDAFKEADSAEAELMAELGMDDDTPKYIDVDDVDQDARQIRMAVRTMTVEENDAAMRKAFRRDQLARTPASKKMVPDTVKPEPPKEVDTAADYQRLSDKKSKMEQMGTTELRVFATELNVLLSQEKSLTVGLEGSQKVIEQFLKDDNREALIAFFKIRKKVKIGKKKT